MSCSRCKVRLLEIAVTLFLLVSAAVLAFPAVAAAEVAENHTGTVVDTHGKAVRDVTVTVYKWNTYLGGWMTECVDVTGRDGRFSVTVLTWAYGATYYYMTFESAERGGYATLRMPALNSDFYDSVYIERRCDICLPEPMTVVLTKAR